MSGKRAARHFFPALCVRCRRPPPAPIPQPASSVYTTAGANGSSIDAHCWSVIAAPLRSFELGLTVGETLVDVINFQVTCTLNHARAFFVKKIDAGATRHSCR